MSIETVLSVVFGGLITIAITLLIEYLRSPKLKFLLDEDAPLDFSGGEG